LYSRAIMINFKQKKISMNKIKKYIKKPIPIEAIQYLTDNYQEVCNFINDFPHKYIASEKIIIISTLEGEHLVRHGDYVIKGIYDEFYPYKPEIFESTYELVN
jgi:hypothetical protein